MKNYFRIQNGTYSLEEMQAYNSENGGDGYEDEAKEGLCACETVGELLDNTAFTTSNGHEVVVLEGEKIETIYDGVRIFPTKVVARMSAKDFYRMAQDGTAQDFETW